MARGWESKFIEEQMAERSAEPSAPRGAAVTKQQRERMQARQSLELSLTRVRDNLARCSNPRYRQMLEAARADLEAKLTRLG